jgi:hypothetical protein
MDLKSSMTASAALPSVGNGARSAVVAIAGQARGGLNNGRPASPVSGRTCSKEGAAGTASVGQTADAMRWTVMCERQWPQ